jgi:hypothetical protein
MVGEAPRSTALNTMNEAGIEGVTFVAANTDAQALDHNRATVKLAPRQFLGDRRSLPHPRLELAPEPKLRQ